MNDAAYHTLQSRTGAKLARDEVMQWAEGVAGFVAFHEDAIEEDRIAAFIEDDFA